MQMWQKMVRRLEAPYIWEVIKGNKDKKCVDLAVHNSAMFIIPSVYGMGTLASQTSANIQIGCILRQLKSTWKFPDFGEC